MRMNAFARWAAPAALALVAFALVSSPARAAVPERSGDLEVAIGWYWPENQSGADVNDDFTYGIRGGYNVTKHFAVQGGIQGFDSGINNTYPTADTTFDIVMVDVSFAWLANPDAKAVFELYAGPGYAWQTVNPPGTGNTIDENVFTGHVGVGAQIGITKSFYIRPDARYRWFDGSDSTGHVDSHGDLEATISFGWYLGGE